MWKKEPRETRSQEKQGSDFRLTLEFQGKNLGPSYILMQV